jgi:hypothetical protein
MVYFVSDYGAVSVASTATLIVASNPLRKGCLIVNNGAATIYLGMDANVTTVNGLPIASNGVFNNSGLNDAYRGDIWGIIASSTADVRFWEYGP